ncbi:MAG: CoF synthetase [Gelidibacter sp.]
MVLNFRNTIFWILDALKGGKIHKHYKELGVILEDYNSDNSKNLRKKHLNHLLNHAAKTVPFYKDIADKNNLEAFPVVNKLIIKDNYDAFKSSSYLNKKKYKVSTSGSSGTPFNLYQNKNKQNRNSTDAIYFAKRAGIAIGIKVYFIRVWTKYNRKSALLSWIQNVGMQNAANLNKAEIENFIAKLLKSKKSKGIWSYASALDTISKYVQVEHKEPINCNMTCVVACSERLNLHTKTTLQTYFNAPVISRYSNAENGILAQQKANTDHFDINWASYYFEIFKFDEDTPAELGELGRVIITDLFNYCMPIIRYDTGDVASIELDEHNVPVFKKVEGRRQDLIYNTKGELISSFVIGAVMKKYSNFKQFQFIQIDEKAYVIKLNTDTLFKGEQQLINEFKEALGNNCSIEIKYLNEIPLLASGKQRQVMSAYNKL